jgi:hypothetical protein
MTAVTASGLVSDLREVQVPVLSAMLLGACAAKLSRVLRTHSLAAGLGPTELFPLPLRRPAAMAVCMVECAVGIALMVTAPAAAHNGSGAMDGAAADGVHVAASAFLLVAVCALLELRCRRPDVGCGCFGDLSTRPVGARSIARSVLLAGAALATIGTPPLRLPPPGYHAALLLAMLCAEFLLIALLSPEISEAALRLGCPEPCELRTFPQGRTLAALRRSSRRRRLAGVITSNEPSDIWRELCWRYVVYPGRLNGADVDVVFAVQMKKYRPVIQSAIVTREPPTAPIPISNPV